MRIYFFYNFGEVEFRNNYTKLATNKKKNKRKQTKTKKKQTKKQKQKNIKRAITPNGSTENFTKISPWVISFCGRHLSMSEFVLILIF